MISRVTIQKRKHFNFWSIIFTPFCYIENKKFKNQLYNKRDAFPFSIVCMPYLDNKIPSNIFYASVGSENSQFAKTSSDLSNIFKSPYIDAEAMKWI